MHKISYSIESFITDQMISDILIAAFEGGINYWSSVGVKVPDWPEGAEFASDVVSTGEPVYIYTDDDQEWHKLNLPKILLGIQWFLSKFNRTPEYFESGEFDAVDADLIVQYSIFGEIVYG